MPNIEPLECRTLLTSGALDLHFGNLGAAEFQYPFATGNAPTAMAKLRNGQTLIAGGYGFNIATLSLLNTDGTLDNSFGDHGTRSLNITLLVDVVVPASDGFIYLVGTTGGDAGPKVVRLTPDLQLDSQFADHGELRIIPSNYGFKYRAHAAIMLPDGSIFIAGEVGGSPSFTGTGSSDIFTTHVLQNGTIDPAYQGGFRRFAASRYRDSIYSLALLPDGNILAAGTSAGDFLLWKIRQDGTFVRGFGNGDSCVSTNFGPTDDTATSMVLLPNSTVAVAGTSGGRFALARYTLDGTLVKSFGDNGLIRFNVGATVQPGVQALLKADGKLILIGSSGNYQDGTLRLTAAAFLLRGRVEYSFGQRGKAFFNFDTQNGSQTRGIAAMIDSRGGVLTASTAFSSTQVGQIALMRLYNSGELDPNFGTAGILTTAIRVPASPSALAIVRQSGGRIITLSSVHEPQAFSTPLRPLITAYSSCGSVDAAFGDSGSLLIPWALYGDGSAGAMMLDPQDRIYIAGRNAETDGKIAIMRLTPSGQVDSSFGDQGIALAPGDATGIGSVHLAWQGGRVLLAATRGDEVMIWRFDSTGAIDSVFAGAGMATISSPNSQFTAAALGNLLVDASSRIVLGASFYKPYEMNSLAPEYGIMALVRLTPDGDIDVTFAQAGRATTVIPGGIGADRISDAALLPDGRIAVVGRSFTDTTPAIRTVLLLYRDDGSLDPAFGDAGIARYDNPPFYPQTIVLKDGKLVVAADHWTGYVTIPTVTRYNLDGSLDATFANGGRLEFDSHPITDRSGPLLLSEPDGGLLVFRSVSSATYLSRILPDDAPSISATVQDDVLQIIGTAEDDPVVLRFADNELRIVGLPHPFPRSSFSAIHIDGLGENDILDASNSPVPVTLLGGDGNDLLLGGGYGDLIQGGLGNDTLFGGKGDDVLHGNGGNDYLNGGPGRDSMFGDENNDQIYALDGVVDLVDGGAGFDRARGDVEDLLAGVESNLGYPLRMAI